MLFLAQHSDHLVAPRMVRIRDPHLRSQTPGSMTLLRPAWARRICWSGLGIRAVEQGFSVQYFRFDELMTALRADAALPPSRLKRRKYMSTALLLVDELGFDPMTRQEASLSSGWCRTATAAARS